MSVTDYEIMRAIANARELTGAWRSTRSLIVYDSLVSTDEPLTVEFCGLTAQCFNVREGLEKMLKEEALRLTAHIAALEILKLTSNEAGVKL